MVASTLYEPFGLVRFQAYAVGLPLSFLTFVLWCYVVSQFNVGYSYSPGSFNFGLFTGLFSCLVGAVLLLAPAAHHRLNRTELTARVVQLPTEAALLGLLVIFWFSAAVATAADFGAPHCHANLCRVIQAAIAFSWFTLLPYAFALGAVVQQWRTRGPTTSSDQPPAFEAEKPAPESPPSPAMVPAPPAHMSVPMSEEGPVMPMPTPPTGYSPNA
ncbi:hypothetical protein H4R33_004145 [Dimargaris cristalligena]|uniref:MARVEL domain-containing protein n=1 Tax=Dimargaris cristalligena TaxID=215637 RepID=A0A4P9ZY62_9FUNG|nr:hypothetical protein H4R33_004145 [Dimargaris cristalligena]RKP38308.1 hypothetical protein BJ085DRAFT_29562 [Dimargaris cristalligena]|eukprot:RKP38308.1 hypothetical protein BJ085DRAFT_29562 [Dimargaris cristalligena]